MKKFDYDKSSPLHQALLGPLVEWFKRVNGRDPEPDDIALYQPYIPLHTTNGVYHDGRTFKDYTEWRKYYDDSGKLIPGVVLPCD